EPAISGDGRYVAFSSWAKNLVADATAPGLNVFVHDVRTGRTVLMSVDSSGVPANDESWHPAISADGRFVAFKSLATNLVPDDTNGAQDVFVRDRDPDGNGVFDEGNGVTTRVSIDSTGVQGDYDSGYYGVAISADGRRVAFDSGAQNLVADDTNTTWDVFVHDRMTGETSRANVDSSGRQANGYSGFEGLAISGDGRLVAFVSEATNLVCRDTNSAEDVFLHELDGEGDAVTLASALPGSGSLSGGDRVNLDGSGFTDRADTKVTFGGLRATVLEVSPSRI